MPYVQPYTGLGHKAKQNFEKGKYRDIQGRSARSAGLYDLYGSALADPAAQGRKFQGFFDEAAHGIAAPAMRDFTNQLATVGANTASRFGGNVSSEEQRQTYNTSDLFSRNLSEALARLAPQAAQLGQNYTGELGTAARGSEAGLDELLGMFDPKKLAKGKGLTKILGTAAGASGGFFLGGPAGASAGAKLGSSL